MTARKCLYHAHELMGLADRSFEVSYKMLYERTSKVSMLLATLMDQELRVYNLGVSLIWARTADLLCKVMLKGCCTKLRLRAIYARSIQDLYTSVMLDSLLGVRITQHTPHDKQQQPVQNLIRTSHMTALLHATTFTYLHGTCLPSESNI